MKTQINSLVTGTTHLGDSGIVGTDLTERMRIAKKVISENPVQMTVEIGGHLITLKAYWSVSGKTVTYSGNFPLDLYYKMFGTHGIPAISPIATIILTSNMNVIIQSNSKFRNSGKKGYQTIPESEVTIL